MKSARTKHERRASLCLPPALWLAVVATLLTLGGAAPARALTTITSSQPISTAINDNVEVDGSDTVVDIGPSGSILGRLTINEGSTVNLSGGSIFGTVDANDSSTVNLSSGSIGQFGASGVTVNANGTSTFNVSGGSIFGDVAANSGSTFNVSGGSIMGAVRGFGTGSINVSGGSVDEAEALGGSTASITGGSAEVALAGGSGTLNLSGGSISAQVVATDTSTLNVFGCNLARAAGSRGQLTGTLADGTTINVLAITGLQGQIVLHNTPPQITCAPTISVNSEPNLCGAHVSASATASTCSGVPLPVTGMRSDQQTLGAIYPVGTTTITWKATDADGNTVSCQQSIIVSDMEKPTITGPSTVTVPTDAGKCTASSTSLPAPMTGDNCAVAMVTNNAPAALPPGNTDVTWTVTDVHGNTNTFTQTVTVKDMVKPVFSNCPTTSPTAVATCLPGGGIGAVVTYSSLSASDNCSTPTIGYSQASGTVFPVGSTPVAVTATDTVGNVGTCSFIVAVRYACSGVLQPINADGSSVFKAGSTVPVKFALTGPSACITNLAATLGYVMVSGIENAPVNEAVSTSAATTGNLFRYTGGQYLFNWSTKGLASGQYELHIDLGDGVTHTVRLGLR